LLQSDQFFLVWAIDNLILFLCFINTTAFYSITGISVICFQISYAIPILLRVIVRRNNIFPKDQGFALGWLSFPIGWCGAIWLIITSMFFFWPTCYYDCTGNATNTVSADTMNYSVVVITFALIVGTIYWWAYARRHFTGPPRQKHEWTKEDEISDRDETV